MTLSSFFSECQGELVEPVSLNKPAFDICPFGGNILVTLKQASYNMCSQQLFYIKKNMKNKILSATIGWLGAIVLLSAYALNSFKIVEGQSLIYQSMNLLGSILIMIYTYYKKAYPNTLL